MAHNASGQLRPQAVAGIALSRQHKREMARACPAMIVQAHDEAGAYRHTLWGPVRNCQTGHATDQDLRFHGSSGGLISALSWYLLRTGAVDGVAQIAALPDEPLRNVLQISRTREDVIRAAGSRYAPAAPLSSLWQLMRPGERVAFVGKPCDVVALRQYLRQDASRARSIPYLLSFMCAGVPSTHGTRELLRAMGADATQLQSFRYRGDGWPGSARAVQRDGQIFEMDYHRSWGAILGRHLQFRCKICPDGTGELADIAAADAWYGSDGYPDFAERPGRSLVLVRTENGAKLLQAAIEAGDVQLEPLDLSQVERMQPYQATRKRMVLGRALAARIALGQVPSYRGLGLWRAAVQASPIAWLRQAWGTLRRSGPEAQ
jgi:coenzyme F420 hydrogenase subunit beta